MGINIAGSSDNGGGGLKKLFGIVGSIFSGGAAGSSLGIGSTAGKIAGGVAGANPNSPLANGLNMYNSANKIADMKFPQSVKTPQTDANFKMPEIGSEFKATPPSLGVGDTSAGAMDRRLTNGPQDNMAKVHNGLQLLKDPEVINSLDHDTYMSAASHLLHAKLHDKYNLNKNGDGGNS